MLAVTAGAGARGAALPGRRAGNLPVRTITRTFVDHARRTPANTDAHVPAARSRTLVTTIWIPQGPGPFPLIVYAHGYNGTGAGSANVVAPWAAAGYVVAAPTFPISGHTSQGLGGVADVANQPGDLRFVLTRVLALARAKGPLKGKVDARHVGVAGHSLGAVTTLGYVERSCCRDPRIDAAISISGTPLVGGTDFKGKGPPLLLIHGDHDPTVRYAGSTSSYARATPPKYLLTVLGGLHGDFLPGGPSPAVPIVETTTLDFWNAYLKGDAEALARLPTDSQPGITTMQSDPSSRIPSRLETSPSTVSFRVLKPVTDPRSPPRRRRDRQSETVQPVRCGSRAVGHSAIGQHPVGVTRPGADPRSSHGHVEPAGPRRARPPAAGGRGRRRLGPQGGRGQAAVCAADEDVLTLAAEAADRALTAAGLQTDIVDGLWWGTAAHRSRKGPSHAVLAAAIGLSTKSGGALCSRLAARRDRGAARRRRRDRRRLGTRRARRRRPTRSSRAPAPSFEARCGAGAAAIVLVAADGGPAHARRPRHADPPVPRPLPRRRRAGDPRPLRRAPLPRGDVPPDDARRRRAARRARRRRLVAPRPRRTARRDRREAARRGHAGVAPRSTTQLGDTGAAAALLGGDRRARRERHRRHRRLRRRPRHRRRHRRRPGRCRARRASPRSSPRARPRTYAEVLRGRGQLVPPARPSPMGVPPESALFVRGADEMLGLLGARCVDCGTINTPPSIHPHCIAAGARSSSSVPLARHGVVHTFVVNHTMPAPFVAPLPLAVIDLDDGARVMLQVVGDGADLEIGTDVDLVLRRYAHERGVPVYGYKVRGRAARRGVADA